MLGMKAAVVGVATPDKTLALLAVERFPWNGATQCPT